MTMILAIMYREFRIRTTSMIWMFVDLFIPLTYLLLFGIGLDRTLASGVAVEGGTIRYDSFFLAGVLAMASFGIAINTAYGFFVDRDNGIFYEFLTYPMTRAEFLAGKIVFNCLLAIAQGALTIALGVAFLAVPLRWERLGLVLAAEVFGTAGWFFFLTPFALRITRNDMFNTLLNVVYFVLMFASSIFYPLDAAPEWLRVASMVNPLTWHTDVLRYATVGIGSPSTVMFEALAFTGFLLLSFWFAVQTLKKGVFA